MTRLREWSRVALAVAHKIGKRVGLDTSTRMAMDADFSADRQNGGTGGDPAFKQN